MWLTYLLCVPEASVYSSVSDQKERDLGNHTEEWSAREQRFDFIHPLGHRTRTLKEGSREIHNICIATINAEMSVFRSLKKISIRVSLLPRVCRWWRWPEGGWAQVSEGSCQVTLQAEHQTVKSKESPPLLHSQENPA